MLVLLAVESTDLMFAVDSVPAVLAVSRDGFVVYTSNVFAVIGLRALYFAARRAPSERFASCGRRWRSILVLVGAKMMLAEVVEISTVLSLAVVGTILTGATVLSLFLPKPPAEKAE